jgi:glutamyl-tRNA synthetase
VAFLNPSLYQEAMPPEHPSTFLHNASINAMSPTPLPVRVRFAPSPTGFFHIGSARTALFNWLYAKHTGGVFILRIEDTDAERNTPEALRVLLEGMRWLGLHWDEGPEVGGPVGPYFQSQRQAIYQSYLEQLKKTGRVYTQDGALWFRVSGKPQVIHDVIRGRVERLEEKDFVIVRANGAPGFHWVNVVDDLSMRITHVIRGEDHLSNTSKHTELYEALGATPPVFAHIPLILKSDGPGKMSKRDHGALIETYRQQHFLPEAVCNALCLLGWSPKDNQEVLPLHELIQRFDLPGISKHNAHFDVHKMAHINAAYTRALNPQDLVARTQSWLPEALGLAALPSLNPQAPHYVQQALALCQEKVCSLAELPGLAYAFFKEDYVLQPAAQHKVLKPGAAQRLSGIIAAIQAAEGFDAAHIEAVFKHCAQAQQQSPGAYMPLVRFALSGREAGPNLYAMMALLGKPLVLERLRRFEHVLPTLLDSSPGEAQPT